MYTLSNFSFQQNFIELKIFICVSINYFLLIQLTYKHSLCFIETNHALKYQWECIVCHSNFLRSIPLNKSQISVNGPL